VDRLRGRVQLGEAPELLDHAKGVLAARAGTRTRPVDDAPALAQRAAGSRAPVHGVDTIERQFVVFRSCGYARRRASAIGPGPDETRPRVLPGFLNCSPENIILK
jgi:hypothetical protein